MNKRKWNGIGINQIVWKVYIGYKIIVFVDISVVVKMLLLELLPRYLPIRIHLFPSFEKGQLHSREQKKSCALAWLLCYFFFCSCLSFCFIICRLFECVYVCMYCFFALSYILFMVYRYLFISMTTMLATLVRGYRKLNFNSPAKRE